MPTLSGYVCAFRGRRDDYQVPIAIHEAGRLDAFVTDAYASRIPLSIARALPARLAEKICDRRSDRIPDRLVRCLWTTAIRERARNLLGKSRAETYALLDEKVSKAACRFATRQRSNLFLYSSYAWHAFSARYPHTPTKILFQYHPHYATELRALESDLDRYPQLFANGAVVENTRELGNRGRALADDSWRLADRIVCASAFTKQSLLAAGADEGKIVVVPYGVDLPATARSAGRKPGFHVLFVGSGVQRKGLHHLLLAWQRAGLPPGSTLTLVCRAIEPAFLPMAAATAGVTLLRGVDRAELERLYGSATLFAMPSLVEGFGQVYLEALSFGLPVLGTKCTGLPELGAESDGVYICQPGDVEQLAGTLNRLSNLLPNNPAINESARRCAARFSWERFRGAIRELL